MMYRYRAVSSYGVSQWTIEAQTLSRCAVFRQGTTRLRTFGYGDRKAILCWLSWGTGLGGFRGTLKQSRTGDFAGKVKEWCDSRCGWKRRVATIRIQKTPCTQDA